MPIQIYWKFYHQKSNILKILPKYETFQIKHSDILHISAKSIDCGYSLEPPACKPQFYYIKVEFKGRVIAMTRMHTSKTTYFTVVYHHRNFCFIVGTDGVKIRKPKHFVSDSVTMDSLTVKFQNILWRRHSTNVIVVRQEIAYSGHRSFMFPDKLLTFIT